MRGMSTKNDKLFAIHHILFSRFLIFFFFLLHTTFFLEICPTRVVAKHSNRTKQSLKKTLTLNVQRICVV